MARAVADDHIQFRAIAAIGRAVAAHAHHAITMRQPGGALVPGGGHAVRNAHFARVDIPIFKHGKIQAFARARPFGGECGRDAPLRARAR